MQKALAINPRSEAAIRTGAALRAGGPAGGGHRPADSGHPRQPKQWKAQAAADPIFAPLRGDAAFRALVAP
jgi:hypothetical protein